jgi:integrase
VFTSERGAPFTTADFAALWSAPVSLPISLSSRTPTCDGIRHACALANKGHDTRALQAYLGHKNIQHTVRYSELSPKRGLGISGGTGGRKPRKFQLGWIEKTRHQSTDKP